MKEVQERIGGSEAFRDFHRVPRVNPGRGVGVLDGHAKEVEVVVRQVLQDGVLLHGGGLLSGILRYGIAAQRIQAHLPQEPHPGAGMYGPGGMTVSPAMTAGTSISDHRFFINLQR